MQHYEHVYTYFNNTILTKNRFNNLLISHIAVSTKWLGWSLQFQMSTRWLFKRSASAEGNFIFYSLISSIDNLFIDRKKYLLTFLIYFYAFIKDGTNMLVVLHFQIYRIFRYSVLFAEKEEPTRVNATCDTSRMHAVFSVDGDEICTR